jgi:hypothetical protein
MKLRSFKWRVSILENFASAARHEHVSVPDKVIKTSDALRMFPNVTVGGKKPF